MSPLEPLDPETVRETAFSAAPFHWRGIPLHPLAIGREADWLLHCQRIGLPPLAESLASTATFTAHAIRLLWFCAHEPSEWLAVWMAGGVGAPLHLDARIRAWAEEVIPPGEQGAAVSLALEIHARAYTNRATIVDGDPDDIAKKAHGRSDSRNTPASLPEPAPASSASIKSSTRSRRSAAGLTSTLTSPRRVSSTNGRTKSRSKKAPSAPA